jgi:hypothetical protein
MLTKIKYSGKYGSSLHGSIDSICMAFKKAFSDTLLTID